MAWLFTVPGELIVMALYEAFALRTRSVPPITVLYADHGWARLLLRLYLVRALWHLEAA